MRTSALPLQLLSSLSLRIVVQVLLLGCCFCQSALGLVIPSTVRGTRGGSATMLRHGTRTLLRRRPRVVPQGRIPRPSLWSSGDRRTWGQPSSLLQVRSALSDAAAAVAHNDTDVLLDDSPYQDDQDNEVSPISAAASPSSSSREEDEEMSRLLEGLTSRPKKSWNVRHPLQWCESFGRRSDTTWGHLKPLIQLKPGDEGYFAVDEKPIPRVTQVRTREHARKVVKLLLKAPPDTIHACDTEVMEIDLKTVGPVGNGYVTCVSVYSGPDFDYGDGPGTCLWIDNLDDACGVLQEFKEWFEHDKHLKAWHNYGFDRHVMWNEGIDVRGFAGIPCIWQVLGAYVWASRQKDFESPAHRVMVYHDGNFGSITNVRLIITIPCKLNNFTYQCN